MALMAPKKSQSGDVLAQAVAILITLSVTGECLQCYWCGPLAEQVHRSQRAPSCEEGATNVTACEPGYTHCAVVASSPPFAESRYCVKFYQDECYTLYCGTTKTYRTTCPCRGELCNGPNTQRELDAFAALADTVKAHNKIYKRNAISNGIIIPELADNIVKTHNGINKRNAISNGFIISSKYRKNLVENDHMDIANNGTNDNAGQTDQPPVSENEVINKSEPVDAKPDSETNDHDTQPANPVEEIGTTRKMESNTEMEEANKNEVVTTQKEAETKLSDVTTAIPIEMTMKPTETMKPEENTFERNDIKPSMQLPTAEALQQSVSSVSATEKPMMSTVTVTEVTMHMTTAKEMKTMMEPKPTNSTKNSSETITFSIFGILTCLIINLVVML